MPAALCPARRNEKISFTVGEVAGFGTSRCCRTPRRANARLGCGPASTSL
ncbi:hypothetical protein ACFYOT_35410 [Saccharothrix saharensis]